MCDPVARRACHLSVVPVSSSPASAERHAGAVPKRFLTANQTNDGSASHRPRVSLTSLKKRHRVGRCHGNRARSADVSGSKATCYTDTNRKPRRYRSGVTLAQCAYPPGQPGSDYSATYNNHTANAPPPTTKPNRAQLARYARGVSSQCSQHQSSLDFPRSVARPA